jgi:hypothetical protein
MIAAKLATFKVGNIKAQRVENAAKRTAGEISTPQFSGQHAAELLNVNRGTLVAEIVDVFTISESASKKVLAARRQ